MDLEGEGVGAAAAHLVVSMILYGSKGGVGGETVLMNISLVVLDALCSMCSGGLNWR